MSKAAANLKRMRDGNPVVPWEDRKNRNHKEWMLKRLAFVTVLNRSSHSDIRKRWNKSLDTRTIAALAIAARYHALPKYVTDLCPKKQYNNIITMYLVNKICNGSKDKLLTIVKDGIAAKELCELQRPPGYVGIVFTAGTTLVKAFEDKVDDIAQLLKE